MFKDRNIVYMESSSELGIAVEVNCPTPRGKCEVTLTDTDAGEIVGVKMVRNESDGLRYARRCMNGIVTVRKAVKRAV